MASRHDYDDLEEEFLDGEEESGFLSIMSMVIGFMAIVGFITLAWYAYRTGTESLQVEDLEVVKADETPLKEVPEDPGGWKFPHQDKTIYETISSRKNAKTEGETKETTVTAPEEPLTRDSTEKSGEEEKSAEKLTAGNTDKSKIIPLTSVVEEIGRDEKDKSNGKDKNNEIAKKSSSATENGGGKRVEQTAESLAAVEPAANGVSTATADKNAVKEKNGEKEKFIGITQRKTGTAKNGSATKQVGEKAQSLSGKKKPVETASTATHDSRVRVQLGAFRSQNEARSSWHKISKKHQQLLSGLEHKVVRADLGKKGVFYRLQVVPFRQSAEAKKLCDELASRKQACFVVMTQ